MSSHFPLKRHNRSDFVAASFAKQLMNLLTPDRQPDPVKLTCYEMCCCVFAEERYNVYVYKVKQSTFKFKKYEYKLKLIMLKLDNMSPLVSQVKKVCNV